MLVVCELVQSSGGYQRQNQQNAKENKCALVLLEEGGNGNPAAADGVKHRRVFAQFTTGAHFPQRETVAIEQMSLQLRAGRRQASDRVVAGSIQISHADLEVDGQL